jgi:dihydrofolate synthase/folylpolyglutamate synthase
VNTSPHLTDLRERFVCNGEEISPEELTRHTNRILEVFPEAAEGKMTFSEILLLIYQLFLEEHRPEFSVLETGMGGRLDPSNALPEKALCILTRIGEDHMEYLGDTLEAVAAEKAGILRPGCPVVYSDLVPEASAVIRSAAESLSCPLYPVSENTFSDVVRGQKSIDFSLHTRYYSNKRLTVPSGALYQAENVSIAVTAATLLLSKESLTESVLDLGLARFHWAARMEEIFPGVFLDGAHNPDGIRALLASVSADGCTGKRRLLFAAMSDKPYERMLRDIGDAALFTDITLVSLPLKRSVKIPDWNAFTESNPELPCRVTEVDAAEVLREMMAQKGERDLIYVAGSLYLAGSVKENFSHDQF